MAEYLGFDRVNGGKGIAKVARGERSGYKNYHFVWDSEKDNIELVNKQLSTEPKTKQVICINTGKIYKSITEASKDTGADASSISRCCQGKQKTAKNLKWKWFEEEQ